MTAPAWINVLLCPVILLIGIMIGLALSYFTPHSSRYGLHSHASAPLPVADAIEKADTPEPEPACAAAEQLAAQAHEVAWRTPPMESPEAHQILLLRVIAGLKAIDTEAPTDQFPAINHNQVEAHV